ncbi:MAG: hypothetical protein IIY55_06480 [Blautia sp.]|nr:hypothetical protein [Blautia sp.]
MKRVCRYKKWGSPAGAFLAFALLLCISHISYAEETLNEKAGLWDQVTVTRGEPLSEKELPESELGIFSWAEEETVPETEGMEYKVYLKPFEGVDLSGWKDWNEEKNAVVLSVRVWFEDSRTEEIPGEDPVQDQENADPAVNREDSNQNPSGETDTPSPDAAEENPSSEGSPEEGNEDSVPVEDTEGTPSAEGEGNTQGDSVIEEPSETVPAEEEGKTPGTENTQDPGAADAPADVENTEGGQNVQLPESTENPENPQNPENPAETAPADIPEDPSYTEETVPENVPEPNIFDHTGVIQEENQEAVSADADFSEEEKLDMAAINHTCDGIFIYGDNLPWYVQFQAVEVDAGQFSIRDGAALFKAYEFRLYDTTKNAEYEIPAGSYVTVSVPVPEGYTYIVEHILKNGATERIVPTLEGQRLLFSTTSFSSYGIAGSNTLAGDENDLIQTPTPKPTTPPSNTPAASPAGSTG